MRLIPCLLLVIYRRLDVSTGRRCGGSATVYVFVRAKVSHAIYLCTEPELIEAAGAAIAVFPYPRKAELIGSSDERNLQEAFVEQLEEFNRQFQRRPGLFRLFFGHFGVAGARVSSGQPLIGRCAEYALDPLRRLHAQYVGLSHIHLRQQLAPRGSGTSVPCRAAITANRKIRAIT